MKKGLALLYRHFARLGLEMHIGRGKMASKMECIFSHPSASLILDYLPYLPQAIMKK